MALSELLSARGFVGAGETAALELLCQAGLARPGKARIAANKIAAVDEALGAAFLRQGR